MTAEDRDRRRRGRPRVEPGSSVSVWLRTSLHERLIERARARDESLSKVIRDLLAKNSPAKK